MKRVSISVVASILLIAACGCASRLPSGTGWGRRSSGGFTVFLTNTGASLGGHVVNERSTKEITGTWWYREDKYGVLIQSKEITYEAFDALVKSLYGEPKEFDNGQRVIPVKMVGVAIWYSPKPYGLEICVNKAMPFQ